MTCPKELAFGFTPVVSPYTTELATSGQPDVKDTICALVQVSNNGSFTGGVNPKKYSTESSNPEKLPRGVIRPEALGLKSPGGTADAPFSMKA